MSTRRTVILMVGLCALGTVASATAIPGLPPLPPTPKRPVVNTYWGVPVTDDYQYLENTADPKVREWAEAENAYTRAWLDGRPERARVLQRVVDVTHSHTPKYSQLAYRHRRYFAMKEQPPREQPMLVMLPSILSTKAERVLVDPNQIDPAGGTSVDFYVPSHDGRFVAVSLSRGGSEDGTVHVYEVASGRALPDTIGRINGGTAGGSVAWNGDASGFFYTRYPREGERPAEELPFYQQIYYHALGTSAEQDHYILGKEFPKIAECALETSRDGKYLLIDVSNGDGGEHSLWLLAAGQYPVQVTRFEDKVVSGHLGLDGGLYLLSRKDAPNGKLLRLDPAAPDLARATVIVPEGEEVIEEYSAGTSLLYVLTQWGGPSEIHIYDRQGNLARKIMFPEIVSFSSLVPCGGDSILVRRQSYLSPPAWFRRDPSMVTLEPTALYETSPADFSDCQVLQERAETPDGAMIPISILMRRRLPLTGKNPTILYGYGSYGISQVPDFDPSRLLWLERGGIFAIAHVRGGGEFGDAWHRAANLEKKKTSIDDFAACARLLEEKDYTNPNLLAAMGGSAGGLLMYGAMVHEPRLMRAVVAYVGYGDVLRTELSPNGLFNTTEFGTVRDSTQFRGMYAYSPYHHVQDLVPYPALLALTGLNDPRVEPWESFKMVARFQATSTEAPILLRVSSNSGHGIGTALSEEDQETADRYTFLFEVLGVAE